MALSNLTTRILVALVGIPVIIGVTLVGGYLFFFLIAAIALVGLLELYGLARAKGIVHRPATGVIMGICLLTVFMYDNSMSPLLEHLPLWAWRCLFHQWRRSF